MTTAPELTQVTGTSVPDVSPRPTGVMIWLSGVDPVTLARCPSETRRFAAVGGVVLTTAGMAALSAIFALRMALHASWVVIVPIAALWGLAIMNLDRWLIVATRRRERWYQNLTTVLPRVLLALIIGAVVSTPLVLSVFNAEIEAELNRLRQAESIRYEKALANDPRFSAIPGLQAEIARLEAVADGSAAPDLETDPTVRRLAAEYTEVDKQYQRAQADAACELDGSCGSGSRGAGPSYRQKQAAADELRARLDELRAQLDVARAQASNRLGASAAASRATAQAELPDRRAALERLNRLKRAEQDQYAADLANSDGLLARLGALSNLTSRAPTLRTAYLLLLLFITTIEVLPVLVTFLTSLGRPTLYEQILADVETHHRDATKEALAHRRRAARRELQVRTDIEKETVQGLVERRMAAEREVYEQHTETWRHKELSRIEAQAALGARSEAARRTPWPAPERAGGARSARSTEDTGEPPRWGYHVD
ncbi:hypothetical protein GCM10009557_07270 [Virgisporangium ochraceum]|uniref:DUF4407 domain-containing protein n=1 Tax=Virgisporangium ochraceum TaxID=65505 RepID=A0A8J4A7W3_9ACTN|nr:DUF4407 domain-containing protein [Virgisporangium ochraceum]GIJ74526.1 hypothetical protein Voc01_094430 [Virgisporangium ochraceum]